MNIINFIKNSINKIKHKNHNNQLLLGFPKYINQEIVNSEKINNIINNLPPNLSEIEKAYYIYIELGKILSENPKFVFTDTNGRKKHYYDNIDDNYFGICKSISDLYVQVLKQIGISAESVKQYPNFEFSHVDTIIKINGKNYICNLISDLSRIKTSRRVKRFCFNLTSVDNNLSQEERENYLNRLESRYGKIDSLTREEIEQMDKKLGYSFYVPDFSDDNTRGIYADDTIELLKQDMNNQESFNEDVPQKDVLKYKLNYIFDNIDKFSHFNNEMNYLERIRYYSYITKKVLSQEELSRIFDYAIAIGDDVSNIISIIKVKSLDDDKSINSNLYYLYSYKDKKYINKKPEEIIEFINDLGSKKLHIVGIHDIYSPRNIDELEL